MPSKKPLIMRGANTHCSKKTQEMTARNCAPENRAKVGFKGQIIRKGLKKMEASILWGFRAPSGN